MFLNSVKKWIVRKKKKKIGSQKKEIRYQVKECQIFT